MLVKENHGRRKVSKTEKQAKKKKKNIAVEGVDPLGNDFQGGMGHLGDFAGGGAGYVSGIPNYGEGMGTNCGMSRERNKIKMFLGQSGVKCAAGRYSLGGPHVKQRERTGIQNPRKTAKKEPSRCGECVRLAKLKLGLPL